MLNSAEQDATIEANETELEASKSRDSITTGEYELC